MVKPKILCVVGTRPEAIKMAPVIKAIQASGWAELVTLNSGQHRDLLTQTLKMFELHFDGDLEVMRENSSLAALTARLMDALDKSLTAIDPQFVIGQGDTTTVLSTALASFYKKIPFGHVEAGLRSGDLYSPFPEEMNRQLASRIATLHFAPTEENKSNLIKEGTAPENIFVTGNTVIDAVLEVSKRNDSLPYDIKPSSRMILVTTHRRENIGEPLRNITGAINDLVRKYSDIEVVLPVHPNPTVKATILAQLGGNPRVHLVEPMNYVQFVTAMKHSTLVMSDSGGIQEEAPALGKPVLVLRRDTERPEAVAMGVAKLVGTDRTQIVNEASLLLENENEYKKMAQGRSPYGDGNAAGRIVKHIRDYLKV